MTFKVVAWGIMCAGALSMLGAQAQDAVVKDPGKSEKGKNRFEAADTDANGSISLEEFKVMFANRPPRPQKDGVTNAPAPTTEAMFNKLDTDKNGSLSKEEMMAGRKKRGQHDEGTVAPKPAEEKAAGQ